MHETSEPTPYVHPTAVVEDGADLGAGTRVWHHAHVRAGSRVGTGCNLGKNVYVDDGVVVGNGVKIQNNVSVYRGVRLGNDVFVGPSAVFTNDRFPRAAASAWEVVPTTVHDGASIGANATVVCGVTIGRWAMVGAGSVVTRDVPENALVVGNPAVVVGWVCACGVPLGRESAFPDGATCASCGRTWPGR